jgi:predicted transcriptional regulator
MVFQLWSSFVSRNDYFRLNFLLKKEIIQSYIETKHHLHQDIHHEDQYNKYELFHHQNSKEKTKRDVLHGRNVRD